MAKLISFMHISLDGFVAGPGGAMNWIKVNEEIFDHVGIRIQQTDTALYGRVTFEMMEGYWPTAADGPNPSKHDIEHSAWYKNANKIVLSNTLKTTENPKVSIVNGDLKERINHLKQQTEKEILVFGSPRTTHALLQNDLIDGFWLFVNPTILGAGTRLFPENLTSTKLQLLSSHTFSCGVVALSYECLQNYS